VEAVDRYLVETREGGLYCCMLYALYLGLEIEITYIFSFPLILQGVSLPPSGLAQPFACSILFYLMLYLGCSSLALSVAGAGLIMLSKYGAAVNFEKLLKEGGGATSQVFR